MSNKSRNQSNYSGRQKAIVIVLFGALALTTVAASIGGAFLSSDRTNADVAAESGVAPSTVSNATYIAEMNKTWQLAWTTGTKEQNAGICGMRANDPEELNRQVGTPLDMPTTMTPEFYHSELGKFFDAKCAEALVTPEPSASPSSGWKSLDGSAPSLGPSIPAAK